MTPLRNKLLIKLHFMIISINNTSQHLTQFFSELVNTFDVIDLEWFSLYPLMKYYFRKIRNNVWTFKKCRNLLHFVAESLTNKCQASCMDILQCLNAMLALSLCLYDWIIIICISPLKANSHSNMCLGINLILPKNCYTFKS